MTLKLHTDIAAELSNLLTRNFQTHSGLETPLRKAGTSHPKLRHLDPLSTSYANFSVRKSISSKTETGALRIRASKVSNHSLAHSLIDFRTGATPSLAPTATNPRRTT